MSADMLDRGRSRLPGWHTLQTVVVDHLFHESVLLEDLISDFSAHLIQTVD